LSDFQHNQQPIKCQQSRFPATVQPPRHEGTKKECEVKNFFTLFKKNLESLWLSDLVAERLHFPERNRDAAVAKEAVLEKREGRIYRHRSGPIFLSIPNRKKRNQKGNLGASDAGIALRAFVVIIAGNGLRSLPQKPA
jgi:hypothetical protein